VVLVNGGFMGAVLAATVTTYLYDNLLEKGGLAEKYDKRLAGLKERSAQLRKRMGQDKARRRHGHGLLWKYLNRWRSCR